MKNILTDSQIEQIESIVLRLEKSVDEFQIINWLNQFNYLDRDIALEILSKVEYFSSKRISQEYDTGIKTIQEDINNLEKEEKDNISNTDISDLPEKIINRHKRKIKRRGTNSVSIHPIGEYGKSGSAMSYYITHTPAYINSKFKILKNLEDINIKNIDNNLYLILADDIIGTGDSFIDYFREVVEPILKCKKIEKITIYLLCIVYLRKAKININTQLADYNIKIIGNKRIEAFSNSGSPFGYRPTMLNVRELCYKYGEDLYIKTEYLGGKIIETKYPLGYKNSQALVVFEHTTPNNTLPIIWSDNRGWIPLYARSV